MSARLTVMVLAATLVAAGLSSTAAAQEPLLGYTVGQDGITFQVPSSGCTGHDSFRLDRAGDVVTLVRTVPDACMVAMLWGTEVLFSWAEIGIEPDVAVVWVANPVTTHGAFRPGPTSWTFGPAYFRGNAGVETLFGYTIDADGITFQVASGGCTGVDSFRIERTDDMLTLVRVTDDFCEAWFQWGTEVTLSPEQLGVDASELERLFVANPLGTHAAWMVTTPFSE